MGLCSGLGRCIITCLNLFFVILSLLLITIGVIAFKASDISFIKTIEDQIKNTLSTMATNVGETNTGIGSFSISEFLDGLGMALIISGCVLLGLSFFGCCGACYKFRTLIFIYALILSVLLLGEVIVVILMYAAPDTIQGHIKDVLLESLKKYKGIGSSDVTSLSWMFVMKEMKCCGVNGYGDFALATSTDWKNLGGTIRTIDAPIVCCKTIPTSTSDVSCAEAATLNIYTDGCFDTIWGAVLGNPVWAGVGYTAAAVFQLLLIVFSVLVYRDLGDKRKNKVYPD